MIDKNELGNLEELLANSKNPVFFGGAGVSTESGIPDFRSQDGLYNQKYQFPPETILSHSFFQQNPEEFYRFYRDKILILDVEPNPAHKFLAQNQIPVVTQNIDGLHQKAGSKRVYELHGSIHRNYCTRCHKFFDGKWLLDYLNGEGSETLKPLCDECGGLIKPDVVLYEEGLPDEVWGDAEETIMKADLMIVAGTSLKVYPAAGLVNLFNNHRSQNKLNSEQNPKLVVIDKNELDVPGVDLFIQGKVGEILNVLS